MVRLVWDWLAAHPLAVCLVIVAQQLIIALLLHAVIDLESRIKASREV